MKLFEPVTNWKKEIFTIPNLLSLLRILLLPVYLWIIFNVEDKKDFYWAAGIILFSGITDLLDGFIARKFNQITELGKLLDPVADKLTQAALAFSLVIYYPKMWLVAILLFFKELFMLVSGWLLLKRKKQKLDGAKWFGKVSTAVFYGTMFLILLFPDAPDSLVTALISLTAIFLGISFVLYAREYFYLFKNTQKK